MKLTPEQTAAEEALQKAIDMMSAAYPIVDKADDEQSVTSGWLVGDWAVIISSTGFDVEGDMHDSYQLAFSGGNMPEYRAKGLFKQALDMMLVGEHIEDKE